MSCLTVNVEGEDGLRRQDGAQRHKLISGGGAGPRSPGGPPEFRVRACRHFLPCLSPLSLGDSERLAFTPVGTEPRPWPFSMVFLSSAVSGPGPRPSIRPTRLPGSALFPGLALSKPDDKIALQFHSLFALIEWQFERK